MIYILIELAEISVARGPTIYHHNFGPHKKEKERNNYRREANVSWKLGFGHFTAVVLQRTTKNMMRKISDTCSAIAILPELIVFYTSRCRWFCVNLKFLLFCGNLALNRFPSFRFKLRKEVSWCYEMKSWYDSFFLGTTSADWFESFSGSNNNTVTQKRGEKKWEKTGERSLHRLELSRVCSTNQKGTTCILPRVRWLDNTMSHFDL